MRQAQMKALRLPHTAYSTAFDGGDPAAAMQGDPSGTVHSHFKFIPGRRAGVKAMYACSCARVRGRRRVYKTYLQCILGWIDACIFHVEVVLFSRSVASLFMQLLPSLGPTTDCQPRISTRHTAMRLQPPVTMRRTRCSKCADWNYTRFSSLL